MGKQRKQIRSRSPYKLRARVSAVGRRALSEGESNLSSVSSSTSAPPSPHPSRPSSPIPSSFGTRRYSDVVRNRASSDAGRQEERSVESAEERESVRVSTASRTEREAVTNSRMGRTQDQPISPRNEDGDWTPVGKNGKPLTKSASISSTSSRQSNVSRQKSEFDNGLSPQQIEAINAAVAHMSPQQLEEYDLRLKKAKETKGKAASQRTPSPIPGPSKHKGKTVDWTQHEIPGVPIKELSTEAQQKELAAYERGASDDDLIEDLNEMAQRLALAEYEIGQKNKKPRSGTKDHRSAERHTDREAEIGSQSGSRGVSGSPETSRTATPHSELTINKSEIKMPPPAYEVDGNKTKKTAAKSKKTKNSKSSKSKSKSREPSAIPGLDSERVLNGIMNPRFSSKTRKRERRSKSVVEDHTLNPITQVAPQSHLGNLFRRIKKTNKRNKRKLRGKKKLGSSPPDPLDSSSSDSSSSSESSVSTNSNASSESDSSDSDASSSSSSSESSNPSDSSGTSSSSSDSDGTKKKKKTKRKNKKNSQKSRKRRSHKEQIKPVEPRVYSGAPDPTEYSRFVQEAIDYVDSGNVHKDRHVFVISRYLKGRAYRLYQNEFSKNPWNYTLEEFFLSLFNECFPPSFKDGLRDQLAKCRQGE
jgi:hypothetical protein